MNKKQLAAAAAKTAKVSTKEATAVLDAEIDEIKQAVDRDERVVLLGFGTFGTGHRAARVGVNPRTGGKMTVPETRVLTFKACKRNKKEWNDDQRPGAPGIRKEFFL